MAKLEEGVAQRLKRRTLPHGQHLVAGLLALAADAFQQFPQAQQVDEIL